MNNHKMRRGMKIEVVNKMCVSGMRVAVICDIVGGRLRLNYVDSKVNVWVGGVVACVWGVTKRYPLFFKPEVIKNMSLGVSTIIINILQCCFPLWLVQLVCSVTS